jgi:PEP-CTERM motif
LIAAAAMVVATPVFAADIFNGDFELGNTGFNSAYTFVAPGANANTAGGQYSVFTNGFPWNPNFTNLGDANTGHGNYMIVNGAGNTSDVVWENSTALDLAPGNYQFHFALADVCCNTGFNNGVDPSPPTLKIQIGDSVISPTDVTISGSGVWKQVTEDFTVSAPGASAVFMIYDTNPVANGNDFGLDDIHVTGGAAPEPASWALMLLGFGGLGAALRSRRRGLVATA